METVAVRRLPGSHHSATAPCTDRALTEHAPCAYCGAAAARDGVHGLDRVNSARHEYVLGNVTACCAHCNLHKGAPSAAVAQQVLQRCHQRETRLARQRCARIAQRWRALLDATRHVAPEAAALFYLRHMMHAYTMQWRTHARVVTKPIGDAAAHVETACLCVR